MASESANLEEDIHDIVVDAYASSAGMDHDRVTPEMLLSDLDSLDLQSFLMETEDQCDALSALRNQKGHFNLPDKKLEKARTVADVIAATVATIESMLQE
ncbi:MAG: hypothetical protein ABIG34_01930 [Candidatus Peregrinibacteria bacterium]